MDVVNSNFMPGDPRLIQQLVYELKSQGIFDQFRKECISDVDTKPAYQNLRQRVEGSVTSFLKQQTWRPDMNKNQVREQLRKNIYESGYLETGVERIVDQVVNPKINTVFLPQVEEVVYRYLGIEKPNRTEVKKELKIDVTDLLPTDLEAVSPESDKKDDDSILNDSLNTDSKPEEDESPPFEPLEVEQNVVQHEENSVDSHLSGFSGLQSHDSNPCNETKMLELSNQDSQASQNSSESHLSIITSEENTKMEICEDSESTLTKYGDSDSKLVKLTDSEPKSEIPIASLTNSEPNSTPKEAEEVNKVDKTDQNEKDDKKDPKKSEDRKPEKKTEDKKCDEKKHDDKKYEKKGEDKKSNSKNSDKHASKDKKDDKHRKSSSKDKDKSSSKHSSMSSSKEKDKNKDKKDIKTSSNSSKEKDKNDKEKDKTDKEKHEKERSDKDKPDKDREKSEKDKSKSSSSNSSRHSSSSSIKDKEKSSSSKKESSSKDKEKDKSRSSSSSASRDNKSKSNHGDSKSSADRHKKNDKPSHNDRPSSSSSNKREKDRRRESKKELKDDHYSAKEKKNHRRSTDRDSNDGQSSKHSQSNSVPGSNSSHSQRNNQESSNLNSGRGSGDSGNSDEIEQVLVKSPTKLSETIENKEVVISCSDVQKFKYTKPKFASNFEEARKLMKIRRQLAKLEKQNQLSLAQIEVPAEHLPLPVVLNGISCEQTENVNEIDKGDNSIEEPKPPAKEDNINPPVVANSVLQSTDLSKESWEALEARLAQEMSNVNYNSYESQYDDYDCAGYNAIVISPKKKRAGEKCAGAKEKLVETMVCSGNEVATETAKVSPAEIKEDITNAPKVEKDNSGTKGDDTKDKAKDDAKNDSKDDTQDDTKDDIKDDAKNDTKDDTKDDAKNDTKDDTKDNTKDDAKKDIKGDAKDDTKDDTEDDTKDDRKDDVNKLILEVKEAADEKVPKEIEEKCAPPAISGEQPSLSIKEVRQTKEKVKKATPDRRITKNLQIILLNEQAIKNKLDFEDQCRYLEKPGPSFDRHLEIIHKYVEKLEQAIEFSKQTRPNNLVPLKRGRKRKLAENFDMKNNNKAHFERTAEMKTRRRSLAPNPNSVVSKANKEKMCNSTDISPNDSFSLPLSPAESDKSNDKKEDSPKPAKQKRTNMNKNTTSRCQRYSSDDLYKPRPIIPSTRRSRAAKNSES